jgi:hypothetical protein
LRRLLAITLLLLAAAGVWAYIYGVLDPYWKAQRQGSDGAAYHSDFYGRWLGTRLALRDHANPYDRTVTEQIQKGIYGHPLEPSSSVDPHGFAYPAHLTLLLAPLSMLPFDVASPIFSAALFAMALSLMPLFMSSLGQRWSRRSVWVAIIALFASFPLALAVYVQQFTVLVIFVVAAGIRCLNRGRFVSAGALFALSTIKPQLVAPLLLWLALWSVTRWRARYRFLVSFLISTVILVLLAELVVPGWLRKWLGAADLFLHYPNLKIPAAFLLPGFLAQFATAAILLPALVLLWRLRSANAGDARFGFAVAIALCVALLVLPIWPALQYNQLCLIPAVLVIIDRYRIPLAARLRTLSAVALATVAFSSAGAFFVAAAVLVFRIPVQRLGHWIELPLFNFAVAPLMLAIVLIGVLWETVPAEPAQVQDS